MTRIKFPDIATFHSPNLCGILLSVTDIVWNYIASLLWCHNVMMQIFPHMEVDDDRGCVLPSIIIKKPSSLSLNYCLLFSSPKNILKYFSLSSPFIYWSHVATFCWNLYGQGHSPLFLSFGENLQYSTSVFPLYLIYLYSRLWLKIERFSFLITWWKFTK